MIFTWLAAALFVISLPLLYRLWKGPTIADRVIATDTALVIFANALVVLAVGYGRFVYAEVGVIFALLGFVGTLVVSKMLASGEL